MSRDDTDRLDDIAEAITKIAEYCTDLGTGGLDDKSKDAIMYNFVVIGEAANALNPEVRATAPEIPWPQIVGLRNFLAHQYFHVEVSRVLEIVDNDLPLLRAAVEGLLQS